MEISLTTFFLIIVTMIFANVCGTLYFTNLGKKNASAAAFWSAMLIAANAFTITNYVENNFYITAAFIGTYLGTFWTLRWRQKQENKSY